MPIMSFVGSICSKPLKISLIATWLSHLPFLRLMIILYSILFSIIS